MSIKSRIEKLEEMGRAGADMQFVIARIAGGFEWKNRIYEDLEALPPCRVRMVVPELYSSPEAWASAMEKQSIERRA